MKTLSYNEDTIALLKFLKQHTPKRIFSDDFIEVIFDYDNFHIIATPEDFVAASQNEFDEITNAKFERSDSKFKPREIDNLLFQYKAISRMWILRTLLYFTDHILYENETEALGNFEINSETDQAIADIMRNATGGHDEIVCHPKGAEAKSVNEEFANLVDAGIMLEIDKKLLMCFSWNNSYSVVGRTMSLNELKEDVAPFYEFIVV